METFFGEIRGNVTNLMAKEHQDLDSVKAQQLIGFNLK